MKNLHVIYSESATGTLKYVLNNLHIKDSILTYKGDISIGPLSNMNSIEGQEYRKKFFDSLYNEQDDYIMNDNMASFFTQDWSIIDKVIVWVANNVAERSLLALICHLVPHSKIYIASPDLLNNDMSYASQSPEVFENLIGKEQLISTDLMDVSQKIWNSISSCDATVRILNNNTVLNADADYYDALILQCHKAITGPNARIVGEVLGSCNQVVSDTYIFNRFAKLFKD